VNDHAIDGIVNCAAYYGRGQGRRATKNFVTLAQRHGPRQSRRRSGEARRDGWCQVRQQDYVFDGTHHTPYVETDATCPNSVYGSTKLEGEQRVQQACRRAMVIRTAWLYSTFGNNFVKTMMRLGNEKPELGVIFDQIGTPTYARDLATVIMTAIEKGIVPGIYHFSNEGVISWYDFTKAIHRLAGITTCHVRPLHTAEYPTPASRPAYSVLDKTKIKQTYGIEVPYWEESLKACVDQLNNA